MNNAKSRKFVTQISISAHKLPVEQGRYFNKYTKRTTTLQHPQLHYLFACKECSLKERRENFIKELLNINVNFKNFDYKILFHYILSLNDDSIFNVTVMFIGDIMESFFIQTLKEIMK